MTKRIFLAGLLGGIAMYVWTAIAHMVLPLGEAGAVCFRGLQADVQAFLDQLRPHFGAGYVAPVPIDYTLGEFRLTGEIRRLTANGSLHYRCASIKAKDLLRLWIQHLVLNTVLPLGTSNYQLSRLSTINCRGASRRHSPKRRMNQLFTTCVRIA